MNYNFNVSLKNVGFVKRLTRVSYLVLERLASFLQIFSVNLCKRNSFLKPFSRDKFDSK
jgi:hypothetical protein